MSPQKKLLVVLSALLVAVLTLSACASIPTGGGVSKIQPTDRSDTQLNFNYAPPNPPAPGADQMAIINGFINAGTGFAENFQTARKFLAGSAATTWKSDQRTLVFQDQPNIVKGDSDNDFKIELKTQSSIDADGIRTPAHSGVPNTVQLTMTRVDGEWRISSIPDGIMIAQQNFQNIFKARSLYFYDPSFSYMVPDVRWFAASPSTVPTVMVKALISGPASYLKGAVASAFPDGIRLVRDTVPIVSSTATVDLTATVLQAASAQVRQQMRAQLQETLTRQLNTVTNIILRADQLTLDANDAPSSSLSLVHGAPVPNRLIGISKSELVYFDNGQQQQIAGIPSVARYQPKSPAESYAPGGPVAFLNGSSTEMYTVSPNQTEKLAVSGVALTPPSFSPSNWVWTAEGNQSGRIFASYPGITDGNQANTVTLTADWLKGRTVTALRVSRDGARVMVISSLNGQSQVQLSGILKQDNNSVSTPRELTAPLNLFAEGLAFTTGNWAGESKILVTAPGPGEVVAGVISVDAPDNKASNKFTALKELKGSTVGNDLSEVYAQNNSGDVFSYAVNGWQEQSQLKDLNDLAFAG